MNTHEHSNTAGPSWFLSSLALRNRMDAHCTGACPRCVSFVCCTVCCTESTAKEVHPRFGTAGAAAKPRATNATSNATRVFKSTFDFQPVSSHVLIMCFWHFESMNWSRHEPRQNRTGTKHFAVPKLIFEPVRIDPNHGNPDIIWYDQNIFENWIKPSEMRVRTYHDMFFDELWKSGLIMKKCGINRYSWYSHQTWLWYFIHIDMEVCYHQTLGAV